MLYDDEMKSIIADALNVDDLMPPAAPPRKRRRVSNDTINPEQSEPGDTEEVQVIGPLKRSRGRPKGSQNRITADQMKLQEDLIKANEGICITEIAWRLANESYEVLHTVEEEYGCDSKQYNTAFSNANKAVATALPYFAIQSKALVLTTDEEWNTDAMANKVTDMIKSFRNNA